MNPKYRFKLNGTIVNPVHKDDLLKDYEKESNQMFYREKLSGKLIFIDADFDFINGLAFDLDMQVTVERLNEAGIWENYVTGIFHKTDCTIDFDNKRIEVSLSQNDVYNEILSNYEKEYNLIQLAPALTSLSIFKRPIIQAYILGSNVVNCYLGGTYWEQPTAKTISVAEDMAAYHFSLNSILAEITVTNNESINGTYAGTPGLNNKFYRSDQLYYLKQTEELVWNELLQQNEYVRYTYIYKTSDNTQISGIAQSIYENGSYLFDLLASSNVSVHIHLVYMRYLLDISTIQGLSTYDIPTDDILSNNLNYLKCIGYGVTGVVVLNSRAQVLPTKYGRNDYNLYFVEPYSFYGDKFYPLSRSSWINASVWFNFSTFDNVMEKSGRKEYVLKDCYLIQDAIKALLAQIAPELTHAGTSDYSQFLYADLNPITYSKFSVMITQKSNVLHGEYDKAAQKAMIQFNELMNMLRDCFQCYWFIDGGKFRIEHISWFKRGGAYSGATLYNVDLTQYLQPKNQKPWEYGKSKIEYDKDTMSQYFEFSWMDDKLSEAFNGFPIEMISNYVNKGKKESITIGKFSPDIDMMLSSPSEISQDGFALFAAVGSDAIPEYPSYGSLVTSTTSGGYSAPKLDLRASMAGTTAKLNVTLSGDNNAGGRLVAIVFYNGSTSILESPTFTLPIALPGQPFNTYSKTINVSIPVSATSFGFKVVAGQVDMVVNSFMVNDKYELPFIYRSVDNADLYLQNGLCSWIYLHPNFWSSNLPAKHIKMNGKDTYVTEINRGKKQTISYPSTNDPDPMKLIKTSIGDGQIEKISVNLSSRMNKITLKYDTE